MSGLIATNSRIRQFSVGRSIRSITTVVIGPFFD
jgi:hypothetical protein